MPKGVFIRTAAHNAANGTARIGNKNALTHGHGSNKIGRSPTYRSWDGMIQRCTNQNHAAYKNYGGRGITVCAEWLDSFEVFLADIGEKPSVDLSLDRIDNEGNYEPANCRWATAKEQRANRRV
jgi:hypothetical protein